MRSENKYVKIKIISYVEIGCKILITFCTWQILDHYGISKCVINIYKSVIVIEKGILHPLCEPAEVTPEINTNFFKVASFLCTQNDASQY